MGDMAAREHGHGDPIDCLTRGGWRVIWVPDFDRSVLAIDEEMLVLADVDLQRHEVCACINGGPSLAS